MTVIRKKLRELWKHILRKKTKLEIMEYIFEEVVLTWKLKDELDFGEEDTDRR